MPTMSELFDEESYKESVREQLKLLTKESLFNNDDFNLSYDEILKINDDSIITTTELMEDLQTPEERQAEIIEGLKFAKKAVKVTIEVEEELFGALPENIKTYFDNLFKVYDELSIKYAA